ncbi:MAG: reverse transcriptase-like protein, partial [Chloroflexota bacterium]|nr:reverse transcriptase-like protein [Chloroflexota bacterium]
MSGRALRPRAAEAGDAKPRRARTESPSPGGTPSPSCAKRLHIFTDGGSRGNPGPGAWAAVISNERGKKLRELSRYLGVVTNNQAEYHALIAALTAAGDYRPEAVSVFMDSELIVNQMTGRYQVRHPNMRPLYEQARALAAAFPTIRFEHVPRDRNREADRLVNAAIDAALGRPARQTEPQATESPGARPRVAFVGLGRMGGPMAANLLRAGYALIVYNRTRVKETPLLAAGAGSATSLAEAVRQSDVVLTCLRDPAAVRDV